MSKIEKLLIKLKERRNEFKYQELKTLLTHYCYEETNKGKSSGSRVAFINIHTKHIIRLYKPHPGNELKKYQIDLILKELIERGVIK